MNIHEWNKVSGEIATIIGEFGPDARPADIMKHWYEVRQYDPDEMEEVWHAVNIGDITVVVGTWGGRGHQFIMWWGTGDGPRRIHELITKEITK